MCDPSDGIPISPYIIEESSGESNSDKQTGGMMTILYKSAGVKRDLSQEAQRQRSWNIKEEVILHIQGTQLHYFWESTQEASRMSPRGGVSDMSSWKEAPRQIQEMLEAVHLLSWSPRVLPEELEEVSEDGFPVKIAVPVSQKSSKKQEFLILDNTVIVVNLKSGDLLHIYIEIYILE